MPSDRFRQELRREARRWLDEGILGAAQFQTLAERYRFDDLESDSRNRFVAIVIGLGSVLLGLGAIAFVAANWQAWGRSLKLVLLLSALVGTEAAGFYLWRAKGPRFPGQGRVGHGLLLLGALLLGANLGLVSQMFHQSGPVAALYLVWAAGVLAMAWGLRLASLGVVSLILLAIAVGTGTANWQALQVPWLQAALRHVPLACALLYVPLAHVCRSRALFGWAAALLLGVLPASLGAAGLAPGPTAAIAILLPVALYWGYSDRAVQSWRRRWGWGAAAPTLAGTTPDDGSDPRDDNRLPASLRFQPVARGLLLAALGIGLLVTSFRGFWTYSGAGLRAPTEWTPAPDLVLDVAILSAIAAVFWLARWRQAAAGGRTPTASAATTALVGVALVAAGTAFYHLQVAALPVLGVVIFNLLLFLLSAGLLRDGLDANSRLAFWGGMGLLVLQIASRTLEYNTDLLFKALVFALCGLGAIAAGLWFERSLPAAGPATPPENRPAPPENRPALDPPLSEE